MSDIENYDLKTVHKQVTYVGASTGIDVGIGAVPTGMKRYITYVKQTNTYTAAATLKIAEGADATTLTTIKDRQKLAAGDTIMYPDTPDAAKPIMSIDEGKFLVLGMSNSSETADVTIGYFDQ